MMRYCTYLLLGVLYGLCGCAQDGQHLSYPEEVHLKNLHQLTFGGDNAEAYFSFDNKHIVFQSNNKAWELDCDQIFISELTAVKDKPQMVSTGHGRTTCAYFMPGNETVVYASTHASHDTCPPAPDRIVDGKYVWPIYAEYEIYIADLKGTQVTQLTDSPGYDAEATVSPDGKMIVFTSLRSGDLELWTMNIDGSDKKQITNLLGYDGGAFFSPDSKRLVFRASRPKAGEEAESYKALLKKGLIQPTQLEIFTCNVDGSDLKQVTHLGNANWAPFFHPSGKKIIFSSNHNGGKGFQFNLYMVNLDGSGLEQITFDKTFDSFPMFSFDGKKLIFSSNRFNGGTHETNIFVADWVEFHMSAYLGEFIGTMILMILGIGVNAGVTLKGSFSQGSGWIIITLGWGMAVAMAVYVVGGISGAHINPAVTLGLASVGEFEWSKVPGYLLAQMLGAIAGAAIVYVQYLPHWRKTEDQAAKLGVFSTSPAIANTPANLLSEIIGTFMLVLGLMGIGSNEFTEGLNPLVVGLLVLSIGMSLGGSTGYAINPARDLGPRIAHFLLPIAGKGNSNWRYAWIPVAGPVIGGVYAGLFYYALFNDQVTNAFWGLSIVIFALIIAAVVKEMKKG